MSSRTDFEMQLTTMAHGGAALGQHEGRAIFVPYAIAGERVRAEIVEDKGRYAHARLVQVLEPSPERVEPPCPFFGQGLCGGCQWQHMAYEAQLRFKTAIVADQLARIGQIQQPPVLPILPDPSGWAYRNHSQFHRTPEGELGFLTAFSHDVIPIDYCLVLHPLLSDLYAALDFDLPNLERLSLRAGTATGDLMMVFETGDDEVPELEIEDLPASAVLLHGDGSVYPMIGREAIVEIVAGRPYRISADSFFQINTAQAEHLVRLVLDGLALQGDEVVLDAFAGVGLFTVPIAEVAALAVAVEVAPSSVEDALANTGALENVDLIEGAVEDVLPELDTEIDAAVVDPPRAGLDRRALDALVARAPRRLVYVSCDPATLARDARRLLAGGYRLESVQPVDMFPQTAHVESVALFRKDG